MPALTYTVNEKVLAFHGPLIYEAKVLKVETRPGAEDGESAPFYFLHYRGWKATWDEWVPTSRLLKLNEAGFAKQKQLIDNARVQRTLESSMPTPGAFAGGTSAKGGPVKGKKGEGGAGSASGSRKRAREGDVEGDYLKRPEVKIPIPDALKVQLVDDWEAVTKNHQLVSLPREPNVHTLIQEYKAYALAQIPSTSSRRGEQPKTAAIISEVLSGLQLYFDRSLGANLLYRFERAQYVDFRRRHQEAGGGAGSGEDFEASKIYGAEHLLRLFVNLPSFIAHTNMDADSIIILREHIGEFMSWMVKEQKKIFLPATSYDMASTAYISAARV